MNVAFFVITVPKIEHFCPRYKKCPWKKSYILPVAKKCSWNFWETIFLSRLCCGRLLYEDFGWMIIAAHDNFSKCTWYSLKIHQLPVKLPRMFLKESTRGIFGASRDTFSKKCQCHTKILVTISKKCICQGKKYPGQKKHGSSIGSGIGSGNGSCSISSRSE